MLLALLAGHVAQGAPSAIDGFDPNVSGYVDAVVVQPDGRIVIGGAFAMVGGQPRERLARIGADGVLDVTFNPGANDVVDATALQPDGRILLGGAFTAIASQARVHFARLLADGSLDDTLNPGVDGNVAAIVVQPDGGIIIGGTFTTVAGQPRANVARFDPSGALDAAFHPDPNGHVRTLALQADGAILLGGDFTTVAGQARSYLARLHADGSLDPTFAAAPNGAVNTITTLIDGRIFIGGNFLQVSGVPHNYLARLQADGTLDASVTLTANAPVFTSAQLADGELVFGGYFTMVGGVQRERLAAVAVNGALSTRFDTFFGANNLVRVVVPQRDGKVIAGGNFATFAGVTRNALARVSRDGSLDATLSTGSNGTVNAIALQADTRILVGGTFTSIGGMNRLNLARLRASGGGDMSFGPNPNNTVNAIVVQPDERIVFGGSFSSGSGWGRSLVARFFPDSTLDSAFNANAGGIMVTAIALQPDNAIILGGQFFTFAGQPRNFLARLHADGSLDPAFNPGADNTVLALARQGDGGILVGGTFTMMAGQPRERLARLDATGALDPTFNPGVDGPVLAIAVQRDGGILLGGSFATVAGTPRANLARLHADGSLDAAFTTESNNTVNTIAVQTDGAILVGGAFTNLGGGARNYLARLNPDGSPDVSFTAGTTGPVNVITVQPDGKVLVGGQFGTLAGETRGGIGRLAAMAPVMQELTIDDARTTITWTRSGPGPELAWVRFEQSTDGATWTDLGLASRVGATSDWVLSGLTLPVTNAFLVRARGIAPSGQYGSSGVIETVRQFAALVPPAIVTQPTDQVVLLGDTAIFHVVVSGTPPLGYQWKKGPVDLVDGGNLSGVWSPTLTLNNVQPGDAGGYNVIVVNAVGGTTSAVAQLTVNLPEGYPVITAQPQSAFVALNDDVTFTVEATGTPDLDYQWRKNGTDLVGETGPTLTVATMDSSDVGSYTVVVGNTLGSITSEPAFLLCNLCTLNGHTYEFSPGPLDWNGAESWAVSRGGHLVSINDQAEQEFLQGFFAVSGDFWIGLSDQLTEGDWSMWSEGTPVTFDSWHEGEPNDSGEGEDFALMYWDANWGAAGWNDVPDGPVVALAEYPFVLTVPEFIVPAANQTANPGDDVSFCVEASGELLAYQWYRDGVAIPGATVPCLELDDVGIADVGVYLVVVSNALGAVISDPVTIVGPNPPPTITTQPESLVVTSGDAATFTVAATAAVPGFVWRRNGVPIAGANGASYTINAAFRSDADWYDVVVFDGLTPTTSGTVRLSVAPASYPGLLINDPAANLALTRTTGDAQVAVLADDGRFYVGGDFLSIDGEPRTNLARFLADGSLDLSFVPPRLNGRVAAILPLADGKVLVGGDFYNVAGATRTFDGLIRLHPDGTLDETTLFPEVHGGVFTLAVQSDGKVLAGGNFWVSNGTPSVLARFHADGSLDAAFQPNVFNGHVQFVMAQTDGRIMIGGGFSGVGGQIRNRLARLNGDGTLDPSFDPGSGGEHTVFCVRQLGDGRYIIAGNFQVFAGVGVPNLARLEANGALDASFGQGATPDGSVTDVVLLPGDELLIAGRFGHVGGTHRADLARLYADGTLDEGFDAGSSGGGVVSVARQSDGRLLVAGGFSAIGGANRQSIARLEEDGALDPAVAPTTLFAAQIRAMINAPDGKLVVAGNFTAIDGVAANRLARLLADGSVDSTFDVGAGPDGDVGHVLLTAEGKIILVGGFNSVNGLNRAGVARLNPDGSVDASFDAGVSEPLNTWNLQAPAVLRRGGRLLIPTSQYTWGGVPVYGMIALNADGTRDATFDIGTGVGQGGYSIMALAAQGDGRVLVGGWFTEFNGQSCAHLVRLNPDGSVDPSFDVGSGDDGDLRAILVQPDGRIVVAGGFTLYNGVPRSHAVRLHPDGSLDAGFDPPGMNNNISLLLGQEDVRFIVGGNFTAAGNAPNTRYLARLEADGSLDPSFQVAGQTSIPEVVALSDDGTLWTATFSTPANNDGLVHQSTGAAPAIFTGPANAIANPGDTVTFSVSAIGYAPSCQWYRDGVAIPGATRFALELVNVGLDDIGMYTVVITNPFGSISSDPVTIVGANPPPVITTQPGPVTAIVGSAANATVTATGVGALTYQWRKFGVPIAGATNATLTLPACEMADGGLYDVCVYDGFSFTRSDVTRLTVAPAQYLAGDLRITSAGPRFENDTASIVALLVLPDGRYYAAGDFAQVNTRASPHLARFQAGGALDPTFLPLDIAGTAVSALARQPDGRLIIGGPFARVGGVPRRFLARLLENGKVDPGFDPGASFDSSVAAIAVQPDGRIVVGGYFTRYDGVSVGRIARLESDGSRDDTFVPGGGFDNGVTVVALQPDGRIVVGGAFQTFDGAPAGRLIRLQADGSRDPDFVSGAGFDNTVTALALQPDGAILVGGDFTNYDGAPRVRLARLLPDGSLDASFDAVDSGLTGTVRSLAVQGDGRIIAVGGFSAGIRRLIADGSVDASFVSGTGFEYSVAAVALLPDDRIVVGGAFTRYNQQDRVALACLLPDGSLDSPNGTWRQNAYANFVLPVAGGRWLVGGNFSLVEGTPHRGLARFQADWTLDPTFEVGAGFTGNVNAAVVQGDGRIVVGGTFSAFAGEPRNGLVRLEPDGALDPTFQTVTTSGVEGMALQRDGRILVSGWWYFAPGMSAQRYLARLNTDGTIDPTFDLGPDIGCVPMALVIQDDEKILAAGYPQTPGQSVLRLTPDGELDPEFSFTGAHNRDHGNFIAMQPDEGILFGGWANTVQRLLPDGTWDAAFDANRDVVGGAVAIGMQTNGRFVVAGWLSDRDSREWIAPLMRFHADGSRDTAFTIPGTLPGGSFGHAPALVYQPDGCLLLGGRVLTEHGEVGGVLRIEPATPLLLAQTPWQTVFAGNNATFAVNAAGAALEYQWQDSVDGGANWNDVTDGGEYTGSVTATLDVLNVDTSMGGRQFRCVITNSLGSLNSAPARLTLMPPRAAPGVAWVQGGNLLSSLGYASRHEPRAIAGEVTAVFAGGQNSFFKKSDGTLWAMGENSYGQLGDGTTIDRSLPVESLNDVTIVAGRWGHSLFVRADGTLWAVGNNANGALGDGTTTDRTIPVQIASDVLAAAAGFNHSLFVTSDHTLWATGSNSSGQLGDGTLTTRSTPVAIATDVQSIAAGGNESFFVTLDGRLFAMGLNSNGQLGDGTTTDRIIPVQVATGVTSVAAAENHTLWLGSDATLWSVGANGAGQLGDGTTTNRSTPAQVATGVSAIAAGGGGSLFIRTDGTLWGMGGLWIPAPGGSQMPLATDVATVAMGEGHTLFARSDGTLWTVGNNASGQLGDGIAAPAQGWLADEVVAASVGSGSSLFVKSDGTLWSQRGATIAPVAGVSDAYAVAVGNYDVQRTFLRADGSLWKLSQPDDVPEWIAGDVIAIGAGLNFIAFIKTDGTLWLQGNNWGVNYGDGAAPVQLDDHVVSFSVAGWHVLYVKSDHTLWALGGIWGGFGDWDWNLNPDWNAMFLAHHSAPIQLETGVRSAVANKEHNLVLRDDGTLWARWSNWTDPPVLVATDVTASASDSTRSFYLQGDEILRARAGVTAPLGAEEEIAGGVRFVGDGVDGSSVFIQRAGFGTAPVITAPPQSVSVPAGTALTLEVVVTGTGPMDYRWFKDGVLIPWVRVSQLPIVHATGADEGEYTCIVTNSAGSVTSDVATLTMLSTFASFQAAHFTTEELGNPAISGPEADPEGDGVNNLLEYAFDTDPSATSAPTVSLPLAVVGDHLELTFARRTDTLDLTYLVEVSGDLTTWSSGPGYTATVLVLPVDAGLELVTERDLTPLSTVPRRFIRVRVTAVP